MSVQQNRRPNVVTKGGRKGGKTTRISIANRMSKYTSDSQFVLAVAELEKQINRFLKGHHKLSALNSLNDIHSTALNAIIQLQDDDRVEAIR